MEMKNHAELETFGKQHQLTWKHAQIDVCSFHSKLSAQGEGEQLVSFFGATPYFFQRDLEAHQIRKT
jgi:hypothetical protein